ncbi:MAG: hypothetical protein MJE68_29400, partial [Proteobacteria bacterium]|nr:hypothetical protein [Pseudomonadota bacterium]
NYQPGDYIFLKIPSIAKYEWHPFTMSSSPEQDFIGLHIRAVGTWTNKLYDFIVEYNKILKNKAEQAERIIRFNQEQNEDLVFANVHSTDVDIEKAESSDCNIPLESTIRKVDETIDFCKRIEVS